MVSLLLFLGFEHSLPHVEFAPLGEVVLDGVPLLDGHPAMAEGAPGMTPAGGVWIEFIGWRHGLQGVGHARLIE